MIYVTTPQTLKSSPSVISISGYSGLAGTSQRVPPFLQTRFSVYSPFSSQTAICFSVGFRSLLSTMMMSPSCTPASIIERPCTRIKYEKSGCGHSIFNTSMSCASSSLSQEMQNQTTTSHQRKAITHWLDTAGRHHFSQLHQGFVFLPAFSYFHLPDDTFLDEVRLVLLAVQIGSHFLIGPESIEFTGAIPLQGDLHLVFYPLCRVSWAGFPLDLSLVFPDYPWSKHYFSTKISSFPNNVIRFSENL